MVHLQVLAARLHIMNLCSTLAMVTNIYRISSWNMNSLLLLIMLSIAFGRLFSFDAGEKKRAVIAELAKGSLYHTIIPSMLASSVCFIMRCGHIIAYREKMKRQKKKHDHGSPGDGGKKDGNTLHVAAKSSENDVKSFKHEKKS